MLIAISEPGFSPKEATIVNELFRAGLDLFHIRKYDSSEKELSELVTQIETEYRGRLVLNHHHELGLSLNLKRFHYSERDRKEWQKRNWEGMSPEYIYSTSVHSLEEFNDLPNHFSYAFLSPVFDSISKPDYKAVKFDFAERRNKATKLIGLGGIQADNVKQVFRMGFDGAAVLGAIWNSENPIEVFENIKNEVQTSHSS
nr:thiamine phosphate synthase [uncultured Fluviicola sp.]